MTKDCQQAHCFVSGFAVSVTGVTGVTGATGAAITLHVAVEAAAR